MTCMNQTVISSVNYLTNEKKVQFWKQPEVVMIKKLEECISLKNHVFDCYNKTLNKITIEQREPFKIFSKTSFRHFEEFVNRLEKVSKQ